MSQDNAKSDWVKTQYSNLIRFRSSGNLFARFKVRGKLIRQSLETEDLAVAKRKLDALVAAERGASADSRNGKMVVRDAIEEFKQRGFRIPVGGRASKRSPVKDRTRDYYDQRIKALLESWKGLEELPMRKVALRDVETWAERFSRMTCASAFNHTVSVLRQIMQIAVEQGARPDNPVSTIGRMREKPKKLQLPSHDQFSRFVAAAEGNGSGKSKHCADLIRFLAFSGLRKSEAANVTWADVDFPGGKIVVWGDAENRTKNGEHRAVPMIQDMRTLLERLRAANPGATADAGVMRVHECQKSMDRAAKVTGMHRITHHDLRHLFATRCIESGVDIPTVSRWLGHKDGGALAMRIYGHLRDEHSASMASRVTFNTNRPV